MKYELIQLPYEANALEPVISKETLGFHHGKHLQAYVNNLNGLIEGTKYEEMPLEEIVKTADGGVFNNAGQILNHFGSFEAFKEEFTKKGATLFGSGWVWLSVDKEGKLVITQETNAGNPVQKGLRPLLTFDVWEHAYYIDYQNRRPDHLNALWQIINWDVVNERL